jgi:hypothetical protein
LQKVAAIVGFIAADLRFMVSEVRLLLQNFFFTRAAISAANFMCLYIL